MKKKAVFLLFLMLCLSVSALADPHTEYVTNPTGRTVNIRQGPGKDYIVDVELKPGTKVTVETIDGAWSHISAPADGWIMSKYLTDKAAPGAYGGVVASTMTRYIYSRNGKKVNVRHGPSVTGYAIAAQLEPGTEVYLLSTAKGWSAVKYNGFTVYVMSKYLSTNKYGPSVPSSFKAFSARIYSVNGKKVNFRVKADVKSDRIAQLEPWTNVEVVGESGGWYKVKWANATGYIMKKYIRAK